ncbi:VanZ family protein [Jeotgalicoccus nanhaiensis]|uniref:VanZ family protein n=1 Tax=Jeotgalicoccus nanhaiensis TaxID=568603 RepID=A0ABR9XZR3_9STAP|nr:VanZ family protein [Jeotgalicoccus nanhaiensis]MBF0754286.1 VanZ family protein [Jeotgalicoccus nanhaiensis]TFU61215.1 VanZ family protein [Jeotgalicoccus nanhaiensis]
MGILFEAFQPVIPIFIMIFMLITVITLMINIKHGYHLDSISRKIKYLSVIGLTMSLVGIFLVTMMPTSNDSDIVELTPFASIEEMWYFATTEALINSVLMNIVLFIPAAFFLYIIIRKELLTTILCTLLSVFIETMQYLLPIGRITSIDDVILNTLGGITGVILGVIFLKFKDVYYALFGGK